MSYAVLTRLAEAEWEELVRFLSDVAWPVKGGGRAAAGVAASGHTTTLEFVL